MLFFAALYFGIPILISLLLLRAGWYDIARAYAIWFGILLVFGLLSGNTWGEALGWPLILGMFLTIPAVPLIILVLKLVRFGSAD
jgi:hypothetical protein